MSVALILQLQNAEKTTLSNETAESSRGDADLNRETGSSISPFSPDAVSVDLFF